MPILPPPLATKLHNRWRKLLTAYYHATHQEFYILSYPKTGRTWLRVLLGKLLQDLGHLPATALIQHDSFPPSWRQPPIYWSHEDAAMVLQQPYTSLSADKSSYQGKNVIILSRDLKDTLVSAYFQATKRIHVFEGSIAEFIRDDRYGSKKVLTYYQHWEQNLTVPGRIHLLRYEALHQDLDGELERLLTFLGLPATDPQLRRQAMDFASFGNLKKLEQQDHFKTEILRPGDRDDPDSFKVRQGKVGDYHNYLSPEDIAYLDDQIAAFGCSLLS
ncbi:sulfotransferase domain-containing protein [Prochlorothrix hollandica]|uniref:sulfotransferase domain-containing protein n=1 Tax=Prochlorothrix hollandica TaxID=1223 RepID=UPI000346E492|nr:sulfotransferase domain-containing protein [Prochlorothrix hollandica]